MNELDARTVRDFRNAKFIISCFKTLTGDEIMRELEIMASKIEQRGGMNLDSLAASILPRKERLEGDAEALAEWTEKSIIEHEIASQNDQASRSEI